MISERALVVVFSRPNAIFTICASAADQTTPAPYEIHDQAHFLAVEWLRENVILRVVDHFLGG